MAKLVKMPPQPAFGVSARQIFNGVLAYFPTLAQERCIYPTPYPYAPVLWPRFAFGIYTGIVLVPCGF